MRLTPADFSDVPFAVAVAVGPDPRELDRLADLADALVAYEPKGPGWLVLIDDAPDPRDLGKSLALPAGYQVQSLHHPRHGRKVNYRKGKGICSAVLLALRWTQANTPAKFVLKLDTDSQVVGPFRDKLADLFFNAPLLAMAGAYDKTPGGQMRDISHHARNVYRMWRAPYQPLHPIRSVTQWFEEPTRTIRRTVLAAAVRNGYAFGEHCLGGGYALSRRFLDEAAAAGYLADPHLWLSVDLPEDVMVGMHVRAVGMTFANEVGVGDVFGVRHVGLPGSLDRLVADGYAVVHSVKNDPRYTEAEVREFFRKRRPHTDTHPPTLKLFTA